MFLQERFAWKSAFCWLLDLFTADFQRWPVICVGSAVHSRSCYIQVHKDKVADAPTHDKEMEHLMGAEGLVLCIEDGKL